jgi:hypothetical protein
MSEKLKYALNSYNLSYFVIIIFSVFFYLIQNPFENIFSNYDQEFWNSYHAIVLYSGYEQELFNDPAHVNYLLLSFFYKIFDFFNIYNIQKLDDLNKSSEFIIKINEIVIIARFFGLIVSTFLYLLILKIYQEFRLENVLIITIALITCNGYLLHLSQYRVEPMTLLLFLFSFYHLILFIKKDKKKLFHLFLFNLFLILSAINKVQILFYAPIYILLILLYKKDKISFQKIVLKFKNYNNDFLKFIITVFLIFILIFFRSEIPHSILFLNIFFLFYLFVLIIIFCNDNFFEIIYKNNFLLIMAFLIIYFITIYVTKGTQEIFWGFFRISKIRGYLGSPELGQGENTLLWLKDFFIFGLNNLITNIKSFFKLDLYNYIIYLILLLTFIKKNRNLFIFLLPILCFFILRYITIFRGFQNYYQIYFDWFIILTLGLILNKKKINHSLKKLIIVSVIFFNVIFNFSSHNLKNINANFFDMKHYCSQKEIFHPYGAWTYFSKKINKDKIIELCKYYDLRL